MDGGFLDASLHDDIKRLKIDICLFMGGACGLLWPLGFKFLAGHGKTGLEMGKNGCYERDK